MAKYRLLLWLQIKAAFKSLPKLIGAALLFTALVGAVGIFGTELLKSGDNDNRMEIALVLPTDSTMYTALAFSFLSDIDTVKNVCTFIEMDKDPAFEALKNGSISAVIVIPDNFIEHIMNGSNTPATIVLPQSSINSKSSFFRELVNAGVDDLGAAQAGIYAVDDVCSYYKIKDGIVQSEQFLNDSYLAYALDRDAYFKTEIISATHNLTYTEFYFCSGIVLLLLLCGISCSELLKRETAALSVSLRRRNIPISLLFVFKLIGVALAFYAILMFAYFMTSLSKIRFPEVSNVVPSLNLLSILSMFLLIFGIFSLVLCIFSFARTQSLGVLMLFTLSTLMLFVSGGFIPSSLLPDMLQKISEFLPTTYYLRLCIEIITNSTTTLTLIINACFSALFITGASLSDILRRNQL